MTKTTVGKAKSKEGLPKPTEGLAQLKELFPLPTVGLPGSKEGFGQTKLVFGQLKKLLRAERVLSIKT